MGFNSPTSKEERSFAGISPLSLNLRPSLNSQTGAGVVDSISPS
jgi:hypothetical protein